MSRPSLGRGMVPSVGMDPGEYCTWGLQDSSGTDISKVMWLEQRNQTDTAGTETAGTVTMQLSTVMLLCTTLHNDQNSYSSIIWRFT